MPETSNTQEQTIQSKEAPKADETKTEKTVEPKIQEKASPEVKMSPEKVKQAKDKMTKLMSDMQNVFKTIPDPNMIKKLTENMKNQQSDNSVNRSADKKPADLNINADRQEYINRMRQRQAAQYANPRMPGMDSYPFLRRSASPLILAAERGHLDIVKFLIEKGADVNARDEYGMTALMYASWNGFIDVVRVLVDKGARVEK